jgi:SAM-dependent methyltransferase
MGRPGLSARMPKYSRYQDYVIRDGRFVGEFEQMYRDHEDPWRESETEAFASEKAVGLNLMARLRARHGARRVVELGCGFGHYTARIAAAGFEATGIDISETAIEKARARHPGLHFAPGRSDDHALLESLQPDVIVMAEITWYMLDGLRGFLDFLRTELPRTYLLHMLTTYPPGVQKYGADYFTDLEGMRRFFGMRYLESGEVHGAQSSRTWFLGAWSEEAERAWHAA